MAKRAVLEFFNSHKSGIFSSWDIRALMLEKLLEKNNIDHFSFYRGFSENSKQPENKRFIITSEEMRSFFLLRKKLNSFIKGYKHIIFHQHAEIFPCGLWFFNNKFNSNYHWIMTDHDSWFDENFSTTKRIIKSVLRYCGFFPEIILGCSNASKLRLQKIYGKSKVNFIHNGTLIPKISQPVDVISKPTKALFVGRLENYKGIFPLLSAIKLLIEKNIEITLTIVGDGAIQDKVKLYIESNNLQSCVKMVGYQSDVSHFYESHHFIIIPSIYEDNCPMVSIESQAYCLPSIFTNSGGIPEIQRNNKTGLMVPKNDSKRIADAILVLQNNPGLYNNMRMAARENSLNFSIEIMAQKQLNLYLKLFKNEKIAETNEII
jgi:glycosyltransferase involved in cell wall biosynthesis